MVLSFQFMIIGGGTSGLRTALYASQHGFKTVMIEPDVLGGTCLNRGCIPTKALLQAVHVYKNALNAKEFGIKTGKVDFDFKKLMARMHSIVEDGQEHIDESLKSNPNLTVIKKNAFFLSPNTVQAGDEVIYADKIVIATGAKSLILPIPGLDKVPYITSDDVLELTKLPKSIIIVGGGYIAMELATFFNGLGTEVIILERMPRALSILDEDVSNFVTECYKEEKIKINTNVNIIGLRQEKGMILAETNDVRDPNSKKITYKAEKLLVSVGRTPNTDKLKVEAAGIALDQRKNIVVNEFLQTANPNVYAMGDCNGKAPFAHGAKRHSKAVLDNALTNGKTTITSIMPYAVFTDPPIAGVGLSENQAKDKKIDYGILKANFSRAGRATIIGDTRGFVKVLFDKKDNKIIGATIVGPNADDIIHEFVALMNSSGIIDTLKEMVHIHPTLSEVMEALKTVS